MGRKPHPNRRAIKTALYLGTEPKEVAYDLNASTPLVYRIYRELGLRLRYVTEGEFMKIVEERKNKSLPI